MKRRSFLKYTAPLSMTPIVLSGAAAMRPFATPRLLQSLADCDAANDRAIVLVQFAGGNDGLNMVIPLEQYGQYQAIRPTIHIPDTHYIELDNTLPSADQVALNPGMTAAKAMYDNARMNIIQGVSYDNQNRSHFKSRDLYWTGGDGITGNNNIETGWMGRYIDAAYPGAAGNPAISADPLGIQFGSATPALGWRTDGAAETAINLYGQDPGGYFSLVNSVGGLPIINVPTSEHGDELNYIMGIENSVDVYAQRITNVFNAGSNSSVTYPDNNFANQLKTIARLMSGGCKTKIYLAVLGGFDTHNGQIDPFLPGQGAHDNLMLTATEAIKAFNDDLEQLSLEDKVLTVTFSEFGRKAVENGNYGTDHGTLAPMMLFGSGVRPGMTGTNVDLSNLEGGVQLQGIQHDYRQVFSTLLQDWLGADNTVLAAAFPTDTFSKINIVNTIDAIDPTCYGAAPLPVEISHFNVQAVDNEFIDIQWNTAVELSTESFEVQRSRDGINFETITKLNANNEPSAYETVDEAPFEGLSYYRLKENDTSGGFSYSEIKTAEIKANAIKTVRVYPNPAVFDINIAITAHEAFEARLQIISMAGMIHHTRPVSVTAGFQKINVDVQRLSAGMYIVRLEHDNGELISEERLMKN